MIREITITPVLNGFVCKVGCQKVVFESISDMAQNLEAYYKNPEATEKRFIADAVNKMNEMPQPCEPTRVCDEACQETVRATEPCDVPTPIRSTTSLRR